MKNVTCHINKNEIGSSILEHILVLALIFSIIPIFYKNIRNISDEIKAINTAKKIIILKNSALNFIRINNKNWETDKLIKISSDNIKYVSSSINYALVNKHFEQGYYVINLYLVFTLDLPKIQIDRISKSIGSDSDIVKTNKTFFIDYKKIEHQELSENDLIFRVKLITNNSDLSKYLHKKDISNFNKMERNLDMNNFSIFNIATIYSDSVKTENINSKFIDSNKIKSKDTYFIEGCFIYPNNVTINNIDIKDDIANFKNINVDTLNDNKFTTSGKIVSNKVSVNNSLNVGNNLKMLSLSKKTINNIEAINSHSLNSTHIKTNEIHFLNGFGINLSYDLMLNNKSPLHIGSWKFTKENQIPTINTITLKNNIPKNPNINDYKKVLK